MENYLAHSDYKMMINITQNNKRREILYSGKLTPATGKTSEEPRAKRHLRDLKMSVLPSRDLNRALAQGGWPIFIFRTYPFVLFQIRPSTEMLFFGEFLLLG